MDQAKAAGALFARGRAIGRTISRTAGRAGRLTVSRFSREGGCYPALDGIGHGRGGYRGQHPAHGSEIVTD
jgi:hypothetical protein